MVLSTKIKAREVSPNYGCLHSLSGNITAPSMHQRGPLRTVAEGAVHDFTHVSVVSLPAFGMSASEQYARLRRRVAEKVDSAMMNVAIPEMLGVYALIGAIGSVYEGAEELNAFNSQQLRDFKQVNYTLFSESDSLSEAAEQGGKGEWSLDGKGWSQRFNIMSKTVLASYLPFSENFGIMAAFNPPGRRCISSIIWRILPEDDE